MAPQKTQLSYSNLIKPTYLLQQYNMLNDMLADMRYPWDMHVKMNTQDFVPTYKNVTVYYKEGESMIIVPPKKPKKKPKRPEGPPRQYASQIQSAQKEPTEEPTEEPAEEPAKTSTTKPTTGGCHVFMF